MKSIKKLSRKDKYNRQLKYLHLLRQAQDQAREVGDIPGYRLLKVEVRRIKEKCLFLQSMSMVEG